jgi:hypothetical protein
MPPGSVPVALELIQKELGAVFGYALGGDWTTTALPWVYTPVAVLFAPTIQLASMCVVGSAPTPVFTCAKSGVAAAAHASARDAVYLKNGLLIQVLLFGDGGRVSASVISMATHVPTEAANDPAVRQALRTAATC